MARKRRVRQTGWGFKRQRRAAVAPTQHGSASGLVAGLVAAAVRSCGAVRCFIAKRVALATLLRHRLGQRCPGASELCGVPFVAQMAVTSQPRVREGEHILGRACGSHRELDAPGTDTDQCRAGGRLRRRQKRTSPLPSPARASAMAPEAGSSMLSIWSTNWRPRPVPVGKGGWPTNCAGWTSWFSTSL